MPLKSDSELLRLLKQNPEKGFAEIYGRYSSSLLRLICRFTNNTAVAEEILHDTFLELWKSDLEDSTENSLKNWLFTLAKNKSLNHFRKTKDQVEFTEQESDSESPLERLESHQLSLRFQKAQEKMPKEFKDVWSLRRLGVAHQGIADQLGIPVGTVKSRFHRMIEFLKESLENEIL